MALNGLFCADVPLRNYLLTHSTQFVEKYLKDNSNTVYWVVIATMHCSLKWTETSSLSLYHWCPWKRALCSPQAALNINLNVWNISICAAEIEFDLQELTLDFEVGSYTTQTPNIGRVFNSIQAQPFH